MPMDQLCSPRAVAAMYTVDGDVLDLWGINVIEVEARISESSGDEPAVFFGSTDAARDLVPSAFDAMLHRLHDRSCFISLKQKPCRFRQEVLGARGPSLIAADQREVALFEADKRGGIKVVGGRQFPILIFCNNRVVARMVVRIRDQRIEAHPPK